MEYEQIKSTVGCRKWQRGHLRRHLGWNWTFKRGRRNGVTVRNTSVSHDMFLRKIAHENRRRFVEETPRFRCVSRKNESDAHLSWTLNYLQVHSWRNQTRGTWRRHPMEAFSALLAICAGNSLPAQRPVTRALMFSMICARINDWVNNRDAGDLRRHPAHCDVIVIRSTCATL